MFGDNVWSSRKPQTSTIMGKIAGESMMGGRATFPWTLVAIILALLSGFDWFKHCIGALSLLSSVVVGLVVLFSLNLSNISTSGNFPPAIPQLISVFLFNERLSESSLLELS